MADKFRGQESESDRVRDHVLGIATIIRDAGYLAPLASKNIAATAGVRSIRRANRLLLTGIV